MRDTLGDLVWCFSWSTAMIKICDKKLNFDQPSSEKKIVYKVEKISKRIQVIAVKINGE